MLDTYFACLPYFLSEKPTSKLALSSPLPICLTAAIVCNSETKKAHNWMPTPMVLVELTSARPGIGLLIAGLSSVRCFFSPQPASSPLTVSPNTAMSTHHHHNLSMPLDPYLFFPISKKELDD